MDFAAKLSGLHSVGQDIEMKFPVECRDVDYRSVDVFDEEIENPGVFFRQRDDFFFVLFASPQESHSRKFRDSGQKMFVYNPGSTEH